MAEKKTINTPCPTCGFLCKEDNPYVDKNITCRECSNTFKLTLKDLSNWSFLICDLAVKYKTITKEQYDKGLAIYEKEVASGKTYLFEDVLVEQGILSARQLLILNYVRDYLELKKLDTEFCNIMIQKDLITQDVADRYLKVQEQQFKNSKTNKTIGNIFVEERILTISQRDQILVEQKRLSKKALDTITEEKTKKRAEKKEGEIELIISDDKVEALIKMTGVFREPVDLDDIKELLEEHSIKHGVVDDETISKSIESYRNADLKFKVAMGKSVDPGKDASIKYFFSTDPKNAQKVNKEDLLAEKTPLVPSKPGLDVYGEPALTPEPKDCRLWCGGGAKLSKDGLKSFAMEKGQPRLSIEGRIFVFSHVDIEGDVNINEGHLDSNSNKKVGGIIPDNVIVKGGDVSAEEIRGADIEIIGDVAVAVGITDARIKTQGKVSASYIRNSEIDAFGDIIVKHEIMDSDITTSGACKVKNSRIISSSIAAKQGIIAAGIGTHASHPCKVSVGLEKHIGKEVKILDDEIIELEERIEEIKEENEGLKEDQKQIRMDITTEKQIYEELQQDTKSAEKEVEKHSTQDDEKNLGFAESLLDEAKKKEKEALVSLKKLAVKFKGISQKIVDIKNEMQIIKSKIQDLSYTKESFVSWSQTQKGRPLVITTQKPIISDTVIIGEHASTVLKEDFHKIAIKESQVEVEEVMEWVVEVVPQK